MADTGSGNGFGGASGSGSDSPGVQGIEVIPGIGIVRIRCLRKAGWTTIDSLVNVTLEELAAVPGIGEVKARQIKEYVLSGAPAAIQSAPAPEPVETLSGSVGRVARLAADLLRAPISHSFDSALARQVGRVASLSDAVIDGSDSTAKRANRALERLRKIESLLRETAHEERLGGKRQARLAEDLRDLRRKVRKDLSMPKRRA
jgi:hypothetical protein